MPLYLFSCVLLLVLLVVSWIKRERAQQEASRARRELTHLARVTAGGQLGPRPGPSDLPAPGGDPIAVDGMDLIAFNRSAQPTKRKSERLAPGARMPYL